MAAKEDRQPIPPERPAVDDGAVPEIGEIQVPDHPQGRGSELL